MESSIRIKRKQISYITRQVVSSVEKYGATSQLTMNRHNFKGLDLSVYLNFPVDLLVNFVRKYPFGIVLFHECTMLKTVIWGFLMSRTTVNAD